MKKPPFFKLLLHRINIFKLLRILLIDMQTQRAYSGGWIKSIAREKGINDTGSSGYEHIKLIFFDYYTIKPDDIIVEVGCGKGRVFNYLLYRGIKNKMIGYEINEAVGNRVKKNLSRFKNVEIRSKNIFDDFPKRASVFYMYNPFSRELMTEFRDLVLNMKQDRPVILYNFPEHKDLYDNENFSMEVINMPRQSGYEAQVAVIKVKK